MKFKPFLFNFNPIFSWHSPKCATLFNGKSPCPLPSTTFLTKNQIISMSRAPHKAHPDEGRIRILFSDTLRVSKTDFVAASLPSCFYQIKHFGSVFENLRKGFLPPASWQRSGARWVSGLDLESFKLCKLSSEVL